MRLKPLAHRVLVQPHFAEEGAQLPDELAKLGFQVKRGNDMDEERRSVLSLDQGTVVAIGENCWMHQDMQGKKPREEWTPWAKVGDRVVFGKYAGKIIQDPGDNEWYLLMNDEDIQVEILPGGVETIDDPLTPEEASFIAQQLGE